jgi:hypothetical protein
MDINDIYTITQSVNSKLLFSVSHALFSSGKDFHNLLCMEIKELVRNEYSFNLKEMIISL